MEDIEHMPLPFEGDWDPALFQAATQLWIVQILDALGIDPQVSFPAFRTILYLVLIVYLINTNPRRIYANLLIPHTLLTSCLLFRHWKLCHGK